MDAELVITVDITGRLHVGRHFTCHPAIWINKNAGCYQATGYGNRCTKENQLTFRKHPRPPFRLPEQGLTKKRPAYSPWADVIVRPRPMTASTAPTSTRTEEAMRDAPLDLMHAVSLRQGVKIHK